MNSILFIGQYPNAIEPTRNCFFQSLIHSIADSGIKCTVIAPVSLTHYNLSITKVPQIVLENTSKGNVIEVLRPRYISYSSKRIGNLRTGRLTEKSFQTAVFNYLRKNPVSFDAVYGHFFLGGGLAAVKIGEEYHKPSYIAFGESDYQECIINPYGNLTHGDLRGLTGIIAVSTNSRNTLMEKEVFHEIPVITAPNGVDASMLVERDKKECRRKLGIPEDIFVVGFVGAFEERKGDKRVHEAVKQLKDVYVAFAGQGELHKGIEVVFCRHLPKTEIPVFLYSLDVFVLPTLAEGCSNAIVEALACGCPIISSNLPFNDDILNDSNSIRIDPRNVNEIKDAILLLKTNSQKRDELSKAAKETAKKLTLEERKNRILSFMNIERS